jgi:hypothetical protein
MPPRAVVASTSESAAASAASAASTGRLVDAEEAAGTCLQRGLVVGDADATGYYGAQLVVIRWLQGREAELVDLVTSTADSATLATPEYAFQILVGAVLARAGRLDEARAALTVPLAAGIDRLPRSSTWTSAMAAAIEAAHSLGDVPLAETAARLLTPFADRPVMPRSGSVASAWRPASSASPHSAEAISMRPSRGSSAPSPETTGFGTDRLLHSAVPTSPTPWSGETATPTRSAPRPCSPQPQRRPQA